MASSDLPVVVSLEVHAGKEQQEIMVEIIEQTWRGMLVKPPASECEQLPSPGELRNKILIKVKYVAPERVNTKAAVKAATPSMRRKKSSSSSSSDSDNQGSVDAKKGKKSSIIESLSALGVYTRSYHFKDLSSPESTVPCHVFSLSEKKFMDIHESHGPTLFSHNRNYLMRAFPAGTRVTSSNLDPAFFWRKGVQIVALNWQKNDAGVMLNEGMFTGSGGWVLKPEAYRGQRRGQDLEVSDESQGDAISHRTLSLSVAILAAQGLPLPVGDRKADGFRPYVKCELHVEKPEERSGQPIEGGGRSKEGEYKHKTKTSRGIQPDFGGENATFSGVPGVVDELSFVRYVAASLPSIAVRDVRHKWGRPHVFHMGSKWRSGNTRYRGMHAEICGGRGSVDRMHCCRYQQLTDGFRFRFKIQDDEFGKDDLAAWACVRLDRLKEGYRFVHLLDATGVTSAGLLLVNIQKSLS